MSESRIVNVAIIGAGEIAMCTHLPILGMLGHLYQVTALVDISKQALDHCGRKFNISRTFNDVGEMLLACPDVDLAFICHSDEFHHVHAIQCLKAGKHLFIEKPMVQTVREAKEVEDARAAAGKIVFVGFMRRFATAFLRVKEIVKELDSSDINYVRIRNFTSRVKDGIISQSGTYSKRFTDYPPESSEDRRRIAQSQYEELTGLEWDSPVSQHIRRTKFHISPHDISLMRELFGLPKYVISAIPNARGNFISVLFQYEGFVVALESGEDEVLSVDATVDICTQKRRIRLAYDSPYIKGLPITATIKSRHPNGDYSEELIRPTYEDYYTLQFKELYRCLVEDAPVKTTPLDYDTALLGDILQAMAKEFARTRSDGQA